MEAAAAKPSRAIIMREDCILESRGKERKGQKRKGEERRGKRRKGEERRGKERKGEERRGKEIEGEERRGEGEGGCRGAGGKE